MSGESEISSDQWMAVCEKDGQQETKIGEANAHEKRRVLQKVDYHGYITRLKYVIRCLPFYFCFPRATRILLSYHASSSLD